MLSFSNGVTINHPTNTISNMDWPVFAFNNKVEKKFIEFTSNRIPIHSTRPKARAKRVEF